MNTRLYSRQMLPCRVLWTLKCYYLQQGSGHEYTTKIHLCLGTRDVISFIRYRKLTLNFEFNLTVYDLSYFVLLSSYTLENSTNGFYNKYSKLIYVYIYIFFIRTYTQCYKISARLSLNYLCTGNLLSKYPALYKRFLCDYAISFYPLGFVRFMWIGIISFVIKHTCSDTS